MLYERTSDLNRLIGRTQHVISMMNGLRKKINKPLIEANRTNVLHLLIKEAQNENLSETIKLLKRGCHLPETCDIGRLCPQFDTDGILLVGGRL